MPLLTIADPEALWLSVAVPEAVATYLRVGAPLSFAVGTVVADTFTARIQSISGAFDSSTRALPVRAVVINARGRLRPEMFARVWLRGASVRGIAVPDAAIQRFGDSLVVFLARPDGAGGMTFTSRTVTAGASDGVRTAIVRGLSSGDTVVVAGAFTVKAQLLRASMPKMEM